MGTDRPAETEINTGGEGKDHKSGARNLRVRPLILVGVLVGVIVVVGGEELGGAIGRALGGAISGGVGEGVGRVVGLAVGLAVCAAVLLANGDLDDLRAWFDLIVKVISAGAVIALFIVGNQINNTIRETETRRAEADSRDKSYQAYLDAIAQLLIDKELGPVLIATKDANYRKNVIDSVHARTQAILRGLDGGHRALIVRFLNNSGFLDSTSPYASVLEEVDLSDCDLTGISLSNAALRGATLVNATLDKATLTNSTLVGAKLNGARLIGANLANADLTNADLTDADLTDADLTRANLTRATVKEEQWKKAKSIKGATLPDGTIGE